MSTSSLPRRPGPTARVRVAEHRGGSVSRREDRVVTEEPLEIRVAAPGVLARRVWVTMRTPGHDFELAVGYLYAEGLVGRDDVRQVAYCTDADLAPGQEFNVVTVTTSRPVVVPERHAGATAGSAACGVCGKDSVEEALAVVPRRPWTGPRPDEEVVRRLPDALRERQRVFDATGGAHAAALLDQTGSLSTVREDVGRHNAVDKTVGAALLAGHDPAAAGLVVSSRAGFEIVQKAVACGVGSVVAVGAPTNLAVSLATGAGIDLWGFVRGDRAVRYA